MTGAIRTAKLLMPDVQRIATFAGGARDTEYRLNGKWVAVPAQ